MVSSTTRPEYTGGENAADPNAPDSGVINGDTVRKKRTSTASPKDDSHVGQVLRTVYQRAVAEDIPSEMLDLLSKLD